MVMLGHVRFRVKRDSSEKKTNNISLLVLSIITVISTPCQSNTLSSLNQQRYVAGLPIVCLDTRLWFRLASCPELCWTKERDNFPHRTVSFRYHQDRSNPSHRPSAYSSRYRWASRSNVIHGILEQCNPDSSRLFQSNKFLVWNYLRFLAMMLFIAWKSQTIYLRNNSRIMHHFV